MRAIALTGCIRDSRTLAHRQAIQGQLQAACDSLNARRDRLHLVSPLTLNLDGEFQALFGHPRHLWQVIATLDAALIPAYSAYGLGVGDIDGVVNREAAIGMDGPAIQKARDALAELRGSRGMIRIGGGSKLGDLVNLSLDLAARERRGWKANRVRIFAGLLQRQSVSAMAAGLGISEQAVYKNIQDGGLETIRDLLYTLGELMAVQLRE